MSPSVGAHRGKPRLSCWWFYSLSFPLCVPVIVFIMCFVYIYVICSFKLSLGDALFSTNTISQLFNYLVRFAGSMWRGSFGAVSQQFSAFFPLLLCINLLSPTHGYIQMTQLQMTAFLKRTCSH